MRSAQLDAYEATLRRSMLQLFPDPRAYSLIDIDSPVEKSNVAFFLFLIVGYRSYVRTSVNRLPVNHKLPHNLVGTPGIEPGPQVYKTYALTITPCPSGGTEWSRTTDAQLFRLTLYL